MGLWRKAAAEPDAAGNGHVVQGSPRHARSSAATLAITARSVLLASHDTTGARAAEQAVLDGMAPGGAIHHLVIVPELWQGMTGDGWRCNGSNVRDFCDYLEGQIDREIEAHLSRVHAAAVARGLGYEASSRHGPLAECLIEEARRGDFELVVIGAPRPKGTTGLRSRMNVEKLMRGLPVPLLVVPHSAAG
jgi:nucleotide-binding universal stress UspA family protein